MSDKRQRGPGEAPLAGDPRELQAEKLRLARHLRSIRKHQRALEVAIQVNFGGTLELEAWREAFNSEEPDDANRTMVVTGDHSAILNSYVEILRASAGKRLIGLLPQRRPRAADVFDAIHLDGGLSESQVTILNELYVLEGRLEHASPDVSADEVFEAVQRLKRELRGFLVATLGWLRRHGIEMEDPP